LLLARKYDVDDWVLPALSALCERKLPLNLEEARQMSIEDVVVVATVREEVRDHKLPGNTAKVMISRRIKAAQDRMFARQHEASDDDSLVDVGKDVAEKEPQRQALTSLSAEGNSYNCAEKEAVAPLPEKADGRGCHASEGLVSPFNLACKRDEIIDEILRLKAGPTEETLEERFRKSFSLLAPCAPPTNGTSANGIARPSNGRRKKTSTTTGDT
jgi:hypothetical protein